MDLKIYDRVRCRLKIRKQYKGRKPRPGIMEFNGLEFIIEVGWYMGKNEPYPGEWALADFKGEEGGLMETCGILWIAEGDVEILEVLKR